MRIYLPLFLAALMVLSYSLTAQVGHWKLDNNFTDSSPNNISSTLIGTPTFSTDSKEGTHAMNVWPSRAINLGTPASFPAGNTPRTIAAWAKTNNISGSRMIMSMGTTSAGQAMFIGQEGSALIGGGWSNNYNMMSPGFWTTGTWHHIAMTYDGATAKLYADGALVGSITQTYNLVLSGAFIGKHLHVSGWWDGAIDDVRIYDRALTQSEIAALASVGAVPAAPTGVTATANTSSSVNLTWTDNATNETGYQIEQSTQATTGYEIVDTTTADVVNYQVTGLSPATQYYFRVRAISGAAVSDYAEATVTTLSAPQTPSGLVGHWRLNGNTQDDSGGGVTGTFIGSPTFETVSKEGSHALKTNGMNQAIDLGTPSHFPTGNAPRTIAAWAKTNTLSGAHAIAAFGTTTAGQAMFIGQDGTSLLAGGWSTMYEVNVSGFWTLNTWHHIAMTYDGTTAKLYADGVEVGSMTKAFNLVLTNAYIGKHLYSSGWWNGSIDDVRIYDRALTSAEIEQLAGVAAGIPDIPTSLSATPLSSGQIELAWSDNATNETGIEISRSLFPDVNFVVLDTLAANSTSFVDTGLNSNTTYYYRIRALGSTGNSDYTSAVSATTGSPSGPVAHWRFDNDLADASGNSRTGTSMNGASFSEVSMQGSHSLSVNGSGQYVNVVNDAGLPAGNAPRTLSAWALTNSVASGYRWVASYGNDANGEAMYIGMYGSDLKVGSWGAPNTFHFGGAWTIGQWKHVCLTYDGAIAKVYINGVEAASQAMSWNLVIDDFFIGRQVNNSAEYWNGLIDDVRVYDRILSPNEVAELAQSTPGVQAPTNLNIVVVGPTFVNIAWQDNSNNESGFEISRSEMPNQGFQPIHVTSADATGYTDSGLQPETQYYYRIRAIGTNQTSSFTSVVPALTKPLHNSVPDEIELQFLREFCESFGGGWANWPSLDDWPVSGTSQDFATWHGVVVQNGDVVGLNFYGWPSIYGTIPASIGQLISLRELRFKQSSIFLPQEINQLKQLRVLKLDYMFSGQFPDLSGLESLEHLSMSAYGFPYAFDSGSIPEWIGNLTKLKHLSLTNAGRTGILPASIYSLTELTYLDLSYNDLTGGLSSAIGNLSTLTMLNLERNNFTGAVPSGIGNLPLVQLRLADNSFTGSLPQSLLQITTLQRLDVSGNSLGTIPAFGNLSNLKYLALGNNSFSGTFPSVQNLISLSTFQIQGNQFTSVPGVDQLSQISHFDASNNQLTSLPDLANSRNRLNHYDISNNPAIPSGPIPSWLQGEYYISFLGLRNTNRTGSLPPDLIGQYGGHEKLDLAENDLSGSIPSHYLTSIVHLDLSHNDFTGDVPIDENYGSNLTMLILSHNRLTGPLPISGMMYHLDVSHNEFSGTFNEELANRLYDTYHFDISYNKLQGPLPENIGDIASNWTPNGYIRKAEKIHLDFSNNYFTTVPESIWQITSANRGEEYKFDFSSNLLSSFPLAPATTTNVSLDISYNFVPGENRTALTSVQRIDEVIGEPQRSNYDPVTIIGYEGQPLTIDGPGIEGIELLWEKKNEAGAWRSVSSLNDDASQVTFLRNSFTTADKGVYRWTIELLEGEMIVASGDITVTDRTYSVIDNLAFQYKYDGRRRMIGKKVPGADWVYMVYDDRDRLVMTQDGNQRNNQNENGNPAPQWTWTKYDQLNRPVMTGIYTHDEPLSQADMSAIISTTVFYETRNDNSALHGYTNNVFHHEDFIHEKFEVLTVTYYDDRSYESMIWVELYRYYGCDVDGQYVYAGTDCQDKVSFPRVKGLVTATKTKVLGEEWETWLWSVNYYDDKGRVVQNISNNALDDFDRVTNRYDFVGKVRETKTVHNGYNWSENTVSRKFDYDHAGRLTKTWHKVNDGDYVLQSLNEYNELGQLITKKLHNTDPEEADDSQRTFEQIIDYRYNIRGWLTSINDPSATQGDKPFAMNLRYEAPTISGVNGQYNGNISQVDWKSIDDEFQQYGYRYDPMNRLEEANYFNQTTTSKTGYFDEKIWSDAHIASYDLNGNILGIQRKGKTLNGNADLYDLMDKLEYTYNGNQLMKVQDLAALPGGGFVDGENDNDDYSYDANGNMVIDKNKGIDASNAGLRNNMISYNHLNLPAIVRKNTGEYIKYFYDATGRKLRQEVYNASDQMVKKSVYAGEFFYEGTSPVGNPYAPLKFINTEEGRVVMTGATPEYQYHLKDHLGNVRVTVSTVEQVETFMATMEAAEANTEQGEFLRYDESVKVTARLFDHTHRDGARATKAKGKPVSSPEVATRLSGIGEERYGLAKSIRVMPGDKIRMEVFAKYVDPNKSDWQANFSDVVSALSQAAPAPALDGALQRAAGASSIPLTAMLIKTPGGKAPKAYLNYVMYDNDFNPITDPNQTNYVQVTEASKENGRNSDHERLYAEVEAKQAGYMYIYLSNDNYELEGEQVDVFFDDFQIQQVHSKVVQSDDYYPFGLTFNSYKRENSVENKIKFQGQEHIDDLNLGWVSFKWRNHDPAIGRFFNVDPLAMEYVYNSPYAFSENRVVDGIELEGLEYFNTTARVGFAVSGNFQSRNNYIRIDRQTYSSTKNKLRNVVEVARGYKDRDLTNRMYDSDANAYSEKMNAKNDWSKVSGKGRIVPDPKFVTPQTNGQRAFIGLGALAVLAVEGLDNITKSQVREDLNETRNHIRVMEDTWTIVQGANESGLLPDGFDFGDMINLANYILDSELPANRNQEYSNQIQELGKKLFEMRADFLKKQGEDENENDRQK